MRIALANALAWMGASSGEVRGFVSGWSIDSRSVQPGEVFFALHGEKHNAHDFVPEVLKRGAFAVIDEPTDSAEPHLIRVENTLAALQRLAKQGRRSWGGRVIAVTGSAGKTSTKDVIAHFLSVHISTAKTEGNLNNHIGLPLSILRLNDSARAAVLEIGMNHLGEIEHLAAIAEPDHGVITNVGFAHIEFFHSIDGIALAKRELIEALPASGAAILNADDERVAAFARVHRGRVITYGFSEGADVRGSKLELTPEGSRFEVNGVLMESPLTGRHGALNVLAGIAAASAFDLRPEDLAEAARTIPIGKMRGERMERNGFIILNDSYNANPEAMRAMLDVLAATPAKRHVAVLGEMLELGAQSDSLHSEIGYYAAERADIVIGVSGWAKILIEQAARRLGSERAIYFSQAAEAGRALRQIAQPGDAILFKGSRGVRVERALDALLEAGA